MRTACLAGLIFLLGAAPAAAGAGRDRPGERFAPAEIVTQDGPSITSATPASVQTLPTMTGDWNPLLGPLRSTRRSEVAFGNRALPPVMQQSATLPHRLHPEHWLDDAPFWMGSATVAARVKLSVDIGDTGLVTRCSVLLSSGMEKLDRAACLLVAVNGRYEPGLDSAGKPARSKDELAFRIDPLPPFQMGYPLDALRRDQRGAVKVLLAIGVNGQVDRCTVTVSSGVASLDAATCPFYERTYRQIPTQDNLGRYLPSSAALTLNWDIPKD